MKTALLFLADGFEEVEALAPLDILRRADIFVKTVSIMERKQVHSAHKVTIEADVLWEELTEPDKRADVYILPGGMPGAENLSLHQGLQELLRQANHEGKIIAALCAAPMVLGKLQILQGKEAICYPGFESHLEGARLSERSVVRDGNIITGKGVGVAFPFGYEILRALTDEATVAGLEKQMIWSE